MRISLSFVLSIIMLITVPGRHGAMAQQSAGDEYSERIKPIVESRCIACHSCYNAPCQLNLQTYSGFDRGATTINIYDAARAKSVPPTRLDIDGKSTAEWRTKGFFDVAGRPAPDKSDPGRSLLLQLTKLRAAHAPLQPSKPAADSLFCPADVSDPRIAENQADLGMPYGLPALEAKEIAALETWLEHGAPGPQSGRAEQGGIPSALVPQVRTWEGFLNGSEPRQPLVSRYLYEHLFLAHLYFEEAAAADKAHAPDFFRLVRSRTPCEQGIDEIATRRPTDAPGTAEMSYCLARVTGTIVDKTHIPYALSPAKLELLKAQFLGPEWTASRAPMTYGDEQANNPFETFSAIPVRARYQFLLDDARYHIATFIKGPVCNGSTAVNSIQEQFFVFFLKPEADSMVAMPEHAAKAARQLVLPGAWGSDIALIDNLPFLTRLVEHREQYRKLRAESVRTLRPKGYSLDDIWTGDGSNPNALLTVFRHFDNAAVVQGAVGDLSKTVFVLDYPLFERLVYNLVANFDVFGNVGHQALTRIYMDLIRMEAEELFLSFLPPSQRERLRRDWYRGGLLTDLKLSYVFPLRNSTEPTAVPFAGEQRSKLQFVQKVMFERMPAVVRGPADAINWKLLRDPAATAAAGPQLPAHEAALRRIASVPAVSASPFAQFFPDIASLIVRMPAGSSELYSIVHNREHENVSWIMGEELRTAPFQDTLTIRNGMLGAYPNMFFVIDAGQADAFASMAAKIKSFDDYDALVARYGVPRTDKRFWSVLDEVTALNRLRDPIQAGAPDLTRYELVRK